MLPPLPDAHSLLSLADPHGARLAEFLYYPAWKLLYVRWHGHLTAAAVVQGTQAGMKLRAGSEAPRLVLNDKSRTSGDWSEALPWLEYEWLPQAAAAGMQAMAYVVSPDPSSQASSREFVDSLGHYLALGLFYDPEAAWQWLGEQHRQRPG